MRMPRPVEKLGRAAALALLPNQGIRPTAEGRWFFLSWLGLMGIGLYLQSNFLLLIAGLFAGPLVASVFVSAATLRRLAVDRRCPPYVFAGEPLPVDYTLNNPRRGAAVAIVVEDELTPVERVHPDAARVRPVAMFTRLPGRSRERTRWAGPIATRGRYAFGSVEVVTRSPFGLLERRLTLDQRASLLVYPRVGRLSRGWQQRYRESTETRRGRRHDRTAQQQEYHGLRDYRPGDSPRWIHWRTTARLGQPMVKEFEQQSEQDLAILLVPWLPRSKVTAEQREALEEAIRFAASLALDTCRQAGRRLALGWTGPAPGLVHGPGSVKLLHELLGQLAVLRGSAEGSLASLLDILPPPVMRDGLLVVVSTRPINLADEVERSTRLGGTAAARGLAGRVVNLDASRDDLRGLVEYDDGPPTVGAAPAGEAA